MKTNTFFEDGSREVCLIDAGNTRVCILMPGETAPRYVATKDFTGSMIPRNVTCAASSVVPAITEMLSSTGAFIVSSSVVPWLDLSKVNASTVGADRLCNMAALAADGVLPAVSFDFGTAVTYEIVGKGNVLLGGGILPGRVLMRKSLNLFTALLPEVPMYDTLPDFPGLTTETNILLGTDGVLVDAVLGVIRRTQELFPGVRVRFAACGGDSAFFASCVGEDKMEYAPDLTLRGLLDIYRRNVRGGCK